jgi:hypothetical protein
MRHATPWARLWKTRDAGAAGGSVTGMNRPTLLPHLRPLWRDRATLQLGTDPDRAIVVEFAQTVSTRILGLLDGTRTERAVVADAAALGIAADDVGTVLAALRRAGVLIDAQALVPPGLPPAQRRRLAAEVVSLAMRPPALPDNRDPGGACGVGTGDAGADVASDAGQRRAGGAPDGSGGAGGAGARWARGAGGARTPAQLLSRRDAARVVVAGQARLAAPIAAALAAAGVGHVATHLSGAVTDDDIAVAGLSPADVGRPANEAVTDLVTGAAPGVRTTTVSLDQATFLVRVGADPTPATLAARAYARRRLPHLAVTVREGAVVVGPFVGPAGSPCLACLDLHRGDRDPAWRTLAAQLATEPAAAQACGVTTTLIGVGYAVSEVLTYLDGGAPRSCGATIEIDGAGVERRRTWPVHPRCDCRRGRRSGARPGMN